MIHVECPFCYFRSTVSSIESDPAFCSQCENSFVPEKLNNQVVLDSKNIRRNSGTATALEIIGAIGMIIAIIVLIGSGFEGVLFSFQCAVSGILFFGFGKLLRLVAEIRWFSKINAEREFRKKG